MKYRLCKWGIDLKYYIVYSDDFIILCLDGILV